MTVTKLILLYALTLMDEDWVELLPIYFLPSTMVIYWAWQGYIGEYTPSGLNNISLGASRLWIYCTTPLEYILQCTLVTPTILLQCIHLTVLKKCITVKWVHCDNIVGVAWVYWIIYSRGVVQYIQRREAPRDILLNPEGVYSPMQIGR